MDKLGNIKNKITELLTTYHVPGMSLGVFSEHSKYYLNLETRDNRLPVTEHTSFRVASLTKPVFAYLVLKLCDEGILDLDTPLLEYYGGRYVDSKYIDQVTTRHILSHQTGFPNWSFETPLTFEFEPGSRFQYSGEGIVYLQNTLEKLTGQYTHDLMRQHIFDPLDMRSSALSPQLLQTINRTQAHDEHGKYLEEKHKLTAEALGYFNRMPRYANAAGTMWASMSDYTTFLHHLMFSEDSQVRGIFERMSQVQVHFPEWNVSWGLGMGLQHVKTNKAMWHWGSDRGFKTFTISYLSDKIGISIFTNGENGFNVYSKVLAMVLDELPEYVKYQQRKRN